MFFRVGVVVAKVRCRVNQKQPQSDLVSINRRYLPLIRLSPKESGIDCGLLAFCR